MKHYLAINAKRVVAVEDDEVIQGGDVILLPDDSLESVKQGLLDRFEGYASRALVAGVAISLGGEFQATAEHREFAGNLYLDKDVLAYPLYLPGYGEVASADDFTVLRNEVLAAAASYAALAQTRGAEILATATVEEAVDAYLVDRLLS
jgi:hypothetical protein